MKATELRLGNYFYTRFNDELEVLQQISKFDVYSHSENSEILSEFKIRDLKPIPLTEEWLLKFGFDVLNTTKWCTNGLLDLDIINEKYWYDNNFIIRYVHQLQNLYFSLTGQELTIKQTV